MKKLLLITFFIPLLTVFLAAESQIKFKETTVDFGEIDSGQVKDMNFEFENTGDSVLIIKNISASCGCTATKLLKKEYQPGEKGTIPVKFNSRGYHGKVTKSITVTSNDKANVYSRLQITGKVTLKNFASVELQPDQINFEKVKLNESYSKKISIKNTGTIDLKIIEVTHSPELTLEFTDKIVKPGKELPVNIVFRPMQQGRFTAFLKIRTNAYRQRLMILRVNAEIEVEEKE
jgi:hypothetical protein